MDSLQAQTGYRLPPKEVVDIIDAKPEPSVSFSPDGKWMLFLQNDAMPSIEDLGRKMHRLAGMRIDPQADGPFQTDYVRGLTLRSIDQTIDIPIPTPNPCKISGVSWSHRSQAFVFTMIREEGTELWSVHVHDPQHPQKILSKLSTVLDGFDWMPDGESLLCCVVPPNRPEEPKPPAAPFGPSIQESLGNQSPTRTYQDLLSNAYDEQLFEYYTTTQLVHVTLKGVQQTVGKPSMIDRATPSPDGKYLLMEILQRPFSYTLTASSFPKKIAVWDRNGNAIRVIADVPVEENIPIEGVRLGPRNVQWRVGAPSELLWTEALDGGDPRNKVPYREKLMTLASPYQKEAQELRKIQHRYGGIAFFQDADAFMVSESDRDRRWTTSTVYSWKDPQKQGRVFIDRSVRDRYGDPGRLVTVPDAAGFPVALQNGDWLYLVGQGASPQGNLPFLDRRSWSNLNTERIWRCEQGWVESIAKVLISAQGDLSYITRKESSSIVPNYHLKRTDGKGDVMLTQFEDPTPQIRGIKKQLVKYTRADGVPLSATLYLPANYQEGQRLPLLVWAYPLEFNDADTAGQVSATPNRFTRMTSISHLSLLTQGYAIMDDATMPIVGDPETMNDTFIEQIVASAKAAIDQAVELGVADRDRVAIGGHSYGAFMTANLMAHCDLFQAGVARSGAYNRTLTPFGFQSERRPLWEAKDIYIHISPFMHAEKIKKPLLLIHGENDNNPGTFPIQSQRMYQAIKGNGGHVRLVMLPLESHGYRARESVLHTHAETIEWLNRYVRDRTP